MSSLEHCDSIQTKRTETKYEQRSSLLNVLKTV